MSTLSKEIFLFFISILFSTQLISQEHRGIWFSDFNPEDSLELKNKILDVKQANLNVIYPYTYKSGMSFHESNYTENIDWYNYDYDVLKLITNYSKNIGLDVHPWLIIGFMPVPDTNSSNILAQNTNWGLQDASGYHALWIDYSNDSARCYLSSIIEELNTNYNIDGIHLDYIRYPDEGIACWSQTAIAKYIAKYDTMLLPPPKRLSFPTFGGYNAYSVAEATSATVLTEFSDGNSTWPASMMNNRGAGKCLLINWNPAFPDMRGIYGGDFHTIFNNALNDWSNSNDTVYVLQTDWNSAVSTVLRLDWMNINYLAADSNSINLLDTQKVLIVPMQYSLSNNLINDIDNWVQSGGKVIFIGGVTGSINNITLQQLVGGKNSIYKYETLVQSPVGTHPWIPVDTPSYIAYAQAVEETEKWDTLQENILSNFVEELHNYIQTNYPDRYLSAAVYPSLEAGHYVMQDWGNWLQNTNVDYILPMSYLNNNSWFDDYCYYYDNLGILDSKQCFPGIGASSPGLSNQQIIQQIQITRNYDTFGHAIFSNYCLSDELINTLLSGVYSQSVTPAYPFYCNKINNLSRNYRFSIFPNPAKDFLQISIHDTQSQNLNIEISDLNGKTIKQLRLGTDSTINISEFENGIYYIRIIFDDNSITTRKFIVEH
jgi:uncharacterized lipoprotein YddW (UPF0748 family)